MERHPHILHERPLLRLLLSLACIALLAGMALPGRDKAAASTDPTTIATTFISLLAKGDFSAAEQPFSPAMRSAAPTATLKNIWATLISQLGAFKRQAGTQVQAAGAARNVIVSCLFARDSADLVVSIDTAGAIVGFHVTNVLPIVTATTVPAYVNKAAFHERAVTIGSAPWTLPGTLSMPNGHGPFPAVVLVAGSGPEDRNETVGADKPFQDIAWGLASQGIAVLRYDKRTLVYGAAIAKLKIFTVQDEFVTDAEAAVRLLAHTAGIDSAQIYVLGHSEGGMVAPLIAQQTPSLAGLILLAAPARPFPTLLLDQYTYLHTRGLVTAAQLAAAKQQVAAIAALKPSDSTRGGLLFGAPPSYWLQLRAYHQTAVAQQLTRPMLIMQGARDYQVTLTDFNDWKAALAHHPHITFKLYANLFHPFIAVPPGAPAGLAIPSAYDYPGHVDAAVMQDLVTWVRRAGR